MTQFPFGFAGHFGLILHPFTPSFPTFYPYLSEAIGNEDLHPKTQYIVWWVHGLIKFYAFRPILKRKKVSCIEAFISKSTPVGVWTHNLTLMKVRPVCFAWTYLSHGLNCVNMMTVAVCQFGRECVGHAQTVWISYGSFVTCQGKRYLKSAATCNTSHLLLRVFSLL